MNGKPTLPTGSTEQAAVLPVQLEAVLKLARNWAQFRSDIRGLALVGSWARGNPKSDSDIDLLFLTTNPHSYWPDTAWLVNLSWTDLGLTITRSVTAEYGVVRSHHVHFADANSIEFAFAPLSWADTNPVDDSTQKVVRNGLRIIFDPDRLFARVLLALTTK